MDGFTTMPAIAPSPAQGEAVRHIGLGHDLGPSTLDAQATVTATGFFAGARVAAADCAARRDERAVTVPR